MTAHEAKARSIVRLHDLSAHYEMGGCGDICECNDGVCEVAVSAIAEALQEERSELVAQRAANRRDYMNICEDLSRKLEEARGRIGELERELGRDDEDLLYVKPMSKEAYEECMRLASDYEDRRAFEVPAVAARIAELEQERDHEKKLHHQANTMRIQQMDRDSVVISSLKAALTRLKAEKEQGE